VPTTETPTTQTVRDEAYDLLAKAEAAALTYRQLVANEPHTDDRFAPAAQARVAALFEQAEWACHRATDRCRTDPLLADAFVRRARCAVWDLLEEVEPPLTEDEQARAWAMVSDQIGDESHKDRVRAYLDSAGKLGVREELAEQDAYLAEEG